MPRAQLTQEQIASMAAGGHRTIDLLTLTPLPAQELLLKVQVKIRGYESNIVQIRWSP
jgi:hypothetical protein